LLQLLVSPFLMMMMMLLSRSCVTVDRLLEVLLQHVVGVLFLLFLDVDCKDLNSIIMEVLCIV